MPGWIRPLARDTVLQISPIITVISHFQGLNRGEVAMAESVVL